MSATKRKKGTNKQTTPQLDLITKEDYDSQERVRRIDWRVKGERKEKKSQGLSCILYACKGRLLASWLSALRRVSFFLLYLLFGFLGFRMHHTALDQAVQSNTFVRFATAELLSFHLEVVFSACACPLITV